MHVNPKLIEQEFEEFDENELRVLNKLTQFYQERLYAEQVAAEQEAEKHRLAQLAALSE